MEEESSNVRFMLGVALVGALITSGCAGGHASCSFNSECPVGRYCGGGTCQMDCSNDATCAATHGAGAVCSSFGQCIGADGGTGHPDANLSGDAAAVDAAAPDASADGGTDAGNDAGTDAGMDAGADSGLDASHDSGSDAGHDASTSDSGIALPGALNETDLPAEADYCVIQFPSTVSTSAGVASAPIYGQIFEAGRTDTTVGSAAPGIRAELGYGPTGSDPRTSAAWMFHAATFNVETGPGNNNDEYVGTLTIAATGGYAYAYRFSFDSGANFTYCDTNGAGSNTGLTFETGNLGLITVM